MPKAIENATLLPAENAGILKNRNGIIGCSVRSSHHRKATSSTANAINDATIRASPHPSAFASIRP